MSFNELDQFIIIMSALLQMIAVLIVWINFTAYRRALEQVCLFHFNTTAQSKFRPNVVSLSHDARNVAQYATQSQFARHTWRQRKRSLASPVLCTKSIMSIWPDSCRKFCRNESSTQSSRLCRWRFWFDFNILVEMVGQCICISLSVNGIYLHNHFVRHLTIGLRRRRHRFKHVSFSSLCLEHFLDWRESLARKYQAWLSTHQFWFPLHRVNRHFSSILTIQTSDECKAVYTAVL